MVVVFIMDIWRSSSATFTMNKTSKFIPYREKVSRDKIFADGSKNKIFRTKFLQMLAYCAEQEHNFA